MKRLILFALLLILIPFIVSAQKKESWWTRGREEAKQQKIENRKPDTFKSGFDEAGFHLQKASSFLMGGTICELLGGGIVALGSSSRGEDKTVIAGAAVAGVGVIFQIIGFSRLTQAGESLRKIKFSGNGLSYTF